MIDLGPTWISPGDAAGASSWMSPGTTILMPARADQSEPDSVIVSIPPSVSSMVVPQQASSVIVVTPRALSMLAPPTIICSDGSAESPPVQIAHSTPVQANGTRMSPVYASPSMRTPQGTVVESDRSEPLISFENPGPSLG